MSSSNKPRSVLPERSRRTELSETVGQFLTTRHVCLNSESSGGDTWRAFLDDTVHELESPFHFNVGVPIPLVRLARPDLLERQLASDVTIVFGAINLQAQGHLSSDASRGAPFMPPVRLRPLGLRIKVNGIMPGIVETEAMKVVVPRTKTCWTDRSIARVCEGSAHITPHTSRHRTRRGFLASAASSWITGVLLDVDGATVREMNPMFPDL